MTASFGGFPNAGFPGAPGMPQQQAPAAGFVLNIPADPNWEPIQTSDVLEKDGYYMARIIDEKPRNDDNKQQLILTLELLDQDVQGKILSKFMPHAETTQKNTWFLWRGLLRSIGGSTAHGKQAFQYTPGVLKGQIVYFKTEPYVGKDGTMTTSVGDWCMKSDWEEAHKTGRARWTPKVPQHMNPAGALPSGVPGFGGGMPALPAAPGMMPGLPGAPGGAFPGLPGAPNVPAPPGTPMQQPPPQPQVVVPQQPIPVQPQAPVFPPQFAPVPSQQPQAPAAPMFAPPQMAPQPPAAVAPPAPFAGFPPANGVPQPPPTAAGIAASFPGLPGAGK